MGVLIYYSFKESRIYTNENLNDEERKEIKAHAVTYTEMNCPMLVSVNSIYNFLCFVMQIRAKGNTKTI